MSDVSLWKPGTEAGIIFVLQRTLGLQPGVSTQPHTRRLTLDKCLSISGTIHGCMGLAPSPVSTCAQVPYGRGKPSPNCSLGVPNLHLLVLFILFLPFGYMDSESNAFFTSSLP